MDTAEKIRKLNESARDRQGIITEDYKQGNEVWGCTDPLAMNYCFTCTIDDGSCIYLARDAQPEQ